MATPTSSSNRSKRKGTKPITQGQNPQRGNRQKVSNAQVTNSSTRGSNAGSAKVTTGRGANAPKPADPWKAPTTKNSRTSAPKSNTTFRTQNTPLTLPNSRAQGKNLPNAAAAKFREKIKDVRPSGKPPVKPSGNFKAPSIPKPSAAAPKPSTAARIGRGLVGKGSIAAMALGAANAADDARLTPSQLKKKYEVVNPDRGQNLLTKFQSGTLGQPNKPKPKQGNAQSRFAGAREANLNRINNDPRFAAPAEKPKPPAPRASDSRPSQTSPSSRTASGSGSQRSAASQAPKPAMPGRKFEDFNPGRGTSKSNNPLLDRDSGGMKLRDRMKQREANAQGEKAKNLSSNFGQDSGYETKTKVDGSKYADKKPDMKKVNEYDRRKRRYYD